MAIPMKEVRPPSRVISGREGVIIFKRYIPRRLKTANASFIVYDPNHLIDSINTYHAVYPPAAPTNREKTSGTVHAIFHTDEKRKLGEDDWEQNENQEVYSAGMDLFYQIDRSRQFGITLYPNFTDVEGDIARDGLSKAFKKFKPEKTADLQGRCRIL